MKELVPSGAFSAGSVDWSAVRRAYEQSDVSVEELCRHHGIAAEDLVRRQRLEGWTRRTDFTPAQLAELRSLYEGGLVSTADILKRFGLTRASLTRLRKSHGWKTRYERQSLPTTRVTRQQPLLRLLASLNHQIAALEERVMQDNYKPTSEDADLTDALVRTAARLDKAGQAIIKPDRPSRESGNSQNQDETNQEINAADVEWIRDQLQRRLATLVERTRPDGGSEGKSAGGDPETSDNDQLGECRPDRSEAAKG